jgi:NAD(P)-dependent dehydrogenase (short-subunit alcohol dehydrogenase family)
MSGAPPNVRSMDLRLDGKVALVTGASKGIGLAIAREMADSGASVMISSRRAEALDAAAAEISGEVATYVANAGDPDAALACVTATVERFGGLDILVNNAATNPYQGPLMGISLSAADKIVQVNQRGVLVWTQAAWTTVMADQGGVVLNIASVGGLHPRRGIGYYNVSKAAVVHLTRQMAAEMAPRVRVNGIAPGLVKTDFARALWEANEQSRVAATPLARLGLPEDVAQAAVFLASDAASWITGQTLVVDGGALIGL